MTSDLLSLLLALIVETIAHSAASERYAVLDRHGHYATGECWGLQIQILRVRDYSINARLRDWKVSCRHPDHIIALIHICIFIVKTSWKSYCKVRLAIWKMKLTSKVLIAYITQFTMDI